jgi:transposase InsO family protein
MIAEIVRRERRFAPPGHNRSGGGGNLIRTLTMLDACTRESPAIEVDTSLAGLRVRRVLDRVASERGLPEAIVLDNGPEFRGRALVAWSEERGVQLEFIQPGKPVQNANAGIGIFRRPSSYFSSQKSHF